MKKLISALAFAAAVLVSVPVSAQQILKVGTDNDSMPFAGLDQARTLSGFFPDVMNAVAKDAGLQIEYEPLAFGDLMDALNDRFVDVVVSNVAPTPGNLKIGVFSKNFYQTRDAILLRTNDNRPYHSISDFVGMTFATVKGTPFVNELKAANVKVVQVEADAQLPTTIEKYHAAAAISTVQQLTDVLKDNAHPKLKLLDNYTAIDTPASVFVVRKTDATLLDKINTSLAKLQADGTIQKLETKWGLS